MFAVLGLGGGTAQAWPWDVKKDVTAFVTYVCNPMNSPTYHTYSGPDTAFGMMNQHPKSTHRETIPPEWKTVKALPGSKPEGKGADPSKEGKGLTRINQVYAGKQDIIHPTYERYGFSTLTWTNYGSGCFSIGHWFTPINNFALNVFVKFPMIVSMAVLHFSMDNVIYDAFATITAPMIALFTQIFLPWGYFIGPIGVFWAFARTRGSAQETLKVSVWCICIIGTMAWLGNNTSTVSSTANNFVTEFAGNAACQLMEMQQGKNCDTDDPLGNIDQSLWYGIPYNAWLEGEVGQDASQTDRALEKQGKVGWGPAILNGQYVGKDSKATRQMLTASGQWDNGSYAPNGDGTKTQMWVSQPEKSWGRVPMLAVVKAMCNDTAHGADQGYGDGKSYQRWMYGGNCDTAGAQTSDVKPHFAGDDYAEQLVGTFTGGIAVLAVLLAIIGVALYLLVQKMLFFFLLTFAPIFLAISMFGDDKRRQFAIKFFERLASNVVKQCAAVCAVLFVSYSMSTLLYPPKGSGIPEIPWILKPLVAYVFFIALLLFALPMSKIMTAAVKGDASIVDKVADAPMNAAKGTAKAAAIAAAAAATGGASLAATGAAGGAAAGGATSLGGAAMGSKAGTLLNASKMMGSRGGVGRASQLVGRAGQIKEGVMNARAQKQGRESARKAGMDMLAKSGSYARDKDGNLTKDGKKALEQDYNAMTRAGKKQQGAQSALRDQARDEHMAQFFAGHRAKTGKYHAQDPENPTNVRMAKVAEQQERDRIRESAKHMSAREGNSEGNNGGGVNLGKDDNSGNNNSGNNNEGVNLGKDGNDGGNSGNNGGVNLNKDQGGNPSYQAKFAEAARENLSGPVYARNPDVQAATVQSGEAVLSSAGLTQSEVARDPSKLLAGAAYDGGDTARMDPQHPATAALTELRLASAEGSSEEVAATAMRAQQVVAAHGVPDEISSIRTHGDTAMQFEPANVLGAIPSAAANPTWQQRAEDANTMQAAVAMMPDGYEAAPAVQAYTSALSNPGVPMGDVNGLRGQAIDALTTQHAQPAGEQMASQAPAYANAAPTVVETVTHTTHVTQQTETPRADPGLSHDSGNHGAEIRDAVAEGLRQAHNTHRSESGPAPSAPVDSAAPGGESPHHRDWGHGDDRSVDSGDVRPRHRSSRQPQGDGIVESILGSPDEAPTSEPTGPVEDNGQSYRRKRRGRSGFYDYDDEDEQQGDGE